MMKRIFFIAVMVSLLVSAVAAQAEPYTREKGWEKEIASMLEADVRQTPPPNPVVFTGSSSIRMWTSLRQDFPHLNVINRGFGGSHLEDLVFFAPRIVLPYKPKKIVVYSGENDIEVGQSAENALTDFKRLIDFRDRSLPGVPIVYISMKPSVLRWAKWPEMKKANELIQAEAARRKNVVYVDISKAMLGNDGRPRPELFLADGLHLNAAGYAVWRKILLPYLK
jgi:lysophospholipase L1-like esterase